MKKFKFTLQTLLDVNMSLEKEQKNRLAIVNNRINALKAERKVINLEIKHHILSYLQLVKDTLDIDKMKTYNKYFGALNFKIQAIDTQIEEQAAKKLHLQNLLSETMKKRKSIEKLKEKQYITYLKELETEEEKIVDGFASYMYTQTQAR